MARMYPPILEFGDIVLVEAVAVRSDTVFGSDVHFLAYQISLLYPVGGASKAQRQVRKEPVPYIAFPYVL